MVNLRLSAFICGLVSVLQAQILPQGPRNILTFSTYLGGSSHDMPHAVATDSQGNVYVVGETVSPDFPVTPAAFQKQHAGVPGNDSNFITGSPRPDAFIVKYDSSGKIVYATYLGGSLDDIAVAVAADSQGNAYVAGNTISPNFPVTPGAFETTANFKTGHSFVAKLNPTGTTLLYSTLIASSGFDVITALRIDSSGNAYIAGNTNSIDFPVTQGAFQTSALPGTQLNSNTHGFVAKLNPAGSQMVYATYLTGSSGALPKNLAISSAGEAFIAGSTTSTDFPTTKGAWLTTFPATGSFLPSSGFLAHLNAAGAALISSTFLPSGPSALDIDASGAAYIAGFPPSTGFPVTPGAYISQTATGFFVAKLNSAASQLVYSASIGGDSSSLATAIAVDPVGNVFVTGATGTSNFPVTANAYQTGYTYSMCFRTGLGPFPISGDQPNCGDAFLSELDPTGAKLLYSTYFGSNGPDLGTALALAPDGSVYLAGYTASALLPVTSNAPQTHRSFGGDCFFEASPSASGHSPCWDGFLARFNPLLPMPVMPWEIVNAASFLPGAIAPGEVVALVGPGIGPAQSATYQLDGNGRVATSLNGIRVLFDSIPAPLLYAGPNQINAVVPYGVSNRSAVPIHIETNGTAAADRIIQLANVNPGVIAVTPGIFAADASGAGQAAAFNQDGTVNSPAHPAPAGSMISFYATGLGSTSVTVPDGTITDPSLLPLNQGTIEVFIDINTLATGFTRVATPVYAGNAPYSVTGVSQINVIIPADTRSGQIPIYVSSGHVVSSQSGMFISVQ